MIKANHGNVEISGLGPEIMHDLTCAVKGVKNAMKNRGYPKELVDDLVADAIRHADMTQEEIVNDVLDALKSLLDKTFKTLKTETENGGNTDDQKPE